MCALALLAGFVYLCVRKVIKPWITLSIFATVALTSLIFWGIDSTRFTDPLFNLLSGGLSHSRLRPFRLPLNAEWECAISE